MSVEDRVWFIFIRATAPRQQGTPSLLPCTPMIPSHSFEKAIKKMRDRNHFHVTLEKIGRRRFGRKIRDRHND